MEHPKVSVIMPTYNHAAFIRESLGSVLAQDYCNVEIIVSDDASSDGTPEILEELAAAHPDRIRLTLQPSNLGLMRNVNCSLRQVTGDYIAMFAGDDIMLPGKLSAQVRHMEAHPGCAVTYHNLEVFDSDSGRTLRLFNSPRTLTAAVAQLLPGAKPIYPRSGGQDVLVRHGCFTGGCSLMFRRSACPSLRYDEGITGAEWLFTIDAASRGTLDYLDSVLARYRRHDGNVTRSFDDGAEYLYTLAVAERRYPQVRAAARAYRRRKCWRFFLKCGLSGRPEMARRHLRLWLEALLPMPMQPARPVS
jgi:glycosyltransferase involved in cell wall biosynthesis